MYNNSFQGTFLLRRFRLIKKPLSSNVIGRKKMIDLIYDANQLTSNELLKIKIRERL